LALVLVGLALGAAYSVEPVRLKGRGLLQLLCLWSIIFVGPMMFTSALVSGFPPPPTVLALAAAYATIQMGVILFNTAEDYPEDKEAGVHTIIVALGLKRGIALGMWLAAVGGAGTLAMLLSLYVARDVPTHFAFPALALLGCVVSLVVITMRSVVVAARREDTDQAALVVKAAGPMVPIWVTAVAWSSFVAALVLFLSGR
jgi:4-hydroxybenzoate polyprenyltransferase